MRRRTFFGIVGAGAAGAMLPLSSVLAAPSRGRAGLAERATRTTSRAATLDFLLAPLAGRSLPGGFRVASISEVERGAVTITLARADGATAAVQVFRRSPLSTGLATTRLLDLRLMNGGDGERSTHEAAGVAVMTLASRVRRIEDATLRSGLGADQRAAVRALSTHERRVAVHGGYSLA